MKIKQKMIGESNRGCEHAASEPNCIALHLMRNHLHIDRLRLQEDTFECQNCIPDILQKDRCDVI